jgi:hypothetical protein
MGQNDLLLRMDADRRGSLCRPMTRAERRMTLMITSTQARSLT